MSELFRCLMKLDAEIHAIEQLLSRHPNGLAASVPLPRKLLGRNFDLTSELRHGRLHVVVKRRGFCYPGLMPRGRRLDHFDGSTRAEIAKHLPRLLRSLSCDAEAERIVRTVSKLRSARQRTEHTGLLRRYFGGTAVVEVTEERLIEV